MIREILTIWMRMIVIMMSTARNQGRIFSNDITSEFSPVFGFNHKIFSQNGIFHKDY